MTAYEFEFELVSRVVGSALVVPVAVVVDVVVVVVVAGKNKFVGTIHLRPLFQFLLIFWAKEWNVDAIAN